MYREKTVEVVAEIQAIVDIDTKAKTQTLQWKNPDYPNTDNALKALALKKRNEVRPRETPARVFLLGEQFKTSFHKNSKGGMLQAKRYMNISSLGARDAKDLAAKLDNMSFSALGY